MINQVTDHQMKLRRVFVEMKLPEELEPLKTIADNLWWSWNKRATELFRSLNRDGWEASGYNPIKIIKELSPARVEELASDKSFLKELKAVYKDYKSYMAEPPNAKRTSVAYFSMEYGLHISLRIYSGGLGVLAGDYLKEASDSNVDLKAIGLLYRYGYFDQSISLHGDQINNYPPQNYSNLPLQAVRDEDGEWLKISVDLPGRQVWAKVWQLDVGRVPLYLLDTDIDENSQEDRALTHQLYGGDNEHRLKQEILLGIGGIKVLEALGLEQNIYHCNEGHAAFMTLERMRTLIEKHDLSLEEAKEFVRGTSLFTTHTPVPAGHDYFPENLLRHYMDSYVTHMGLDWFQFVSMGRIDAYDSDELFSMSHLAIRMCQEVNGVSKLHGSVSQNMFQTLFPGYTKDENHIGYVTNSVHYPTWIDTKWHELFEKHLDKSFVKDQSNFKLWEKVNDIPSEDIMKVRRSLKSRLLKYVREKVQEDLTRRGEKPSVIFDILNNISEDALIFGFARRFATYKRAHLLFNNPERLAELVNQTGKPVMFLFAGKAHPADQGGQGLIRNIIELSNRPEFRGKVIFLEGYNMEMAKLLVRGVDIWLNTPTRPLEASGTSGMKAAMNGVMNCSVLDGWWAEGYRPDSGWSLPIERTYENQALQDELDAESLYNIFENEIIPAFYDQNKKGISERWVTYIRNIVSKVAPYFTMKRMLDDYYDKFYSKLEESRQFLIGRKGQNLVDFTEWKNRMEANWDEIEVVEVDAVDSDHHSVNAGDTIPNYVKVALKEINPEEIELEAVAYRRVDEELVPEFNQALTYVDTQDGISKFEVDFLPTLSGEYEYGIRMYPKHESLPNRQALNLVRWV